MKRTLIMVLMASAIVFSGPRASEAAADNARTGVQELGATENPKMPGTITKKTSFYDAGLSKYIEKKRSYFQGRFHGKDFASMMIKTYAELPCVKEVKEGSGNVMSVTWDDGEIYDIKIFPLIRKPGMNQVKPDVIDASALVGLSLSQCQAKYHLEQYKAWPTPNLAPDSDSETRYFMEHGDLVIRSDRSNNVTSAIFSPSALSPDERLAHVYYGWDEFVKKHKTGNRTAPG